MEPKTKEQEKVFRVADRVDGKVYKNYSGRSMFGDICMGVVCDNPTKCIEVAAKMGLTGARTDNMGLQYIVYWPNIKGIQDDED